MPHVPQRLRPQFQPDQEQHQHHAEFGKLLQIAGFRPGQPHHRPHQDARRQIAQHRPQPQPHRQRHHQHGGTKIDRGLQQETFHHGLSQSRHAGPGVTSSHQSGGKRRAARAVNPPCRPFQPFGSARVSIRPPFWYCTALAVMAATRPPSIVSPTTIFFTPPPGWRTRA